MSLCRVTLTYLTQRSSIVKYIKEGKAKNKGSLCEGTEPSVVTIIKSVSDSRAKICSDKTRQKSGKLNVTSIL